ncbi:PREDICTED: multidrug resistance-associated protein 4-like [Rhagoletis zephyria]|uniref:multidrug resistance-associated protein 4-like n=1 Tax=Rhagoletis zephyria TaxID=28612 RepID=UPI0008112860|nr:PREDICTED: multidrug resistance-associated protein 4-like [Rhagoletis zephyria]
MVDDRGTSLSGGQRARISLARALYTDADCYLLDDPLSAVDSSVSKHIFEKCIKEYLRNKCVILVTHQLQFIKQADQIVVLKDGACFACGSYIELLNKATVVPDQQTEKSPEGSPSSRRQSIRRRIESFNERHSRSNSYIESDHESMYDEVSILDYVQAAESRERSNQPTSLELPNSERSTSSKPKKRVRQLSEVDANYLVSVERVVEFGELEKEPLEECIQEPHESWPQRGNIVYENVSLAYDGAGDDPPQLVLRDLNFNIKGGEKVGIVGRTGAGKSSLITTLFRLTQPTGQIFIDNIDTADISLSRLRRGLAIIPQEPILFSGTIRRNLDPFNEKSDEELWDAIDKVQLKTKIQSFPSKLDSSVSECGSDFSVGQKQLICLARAILRRSPILILDECTAAVDPRTDSLIQQTIRNEFANNTVLTIAHRLNTIIDNERVMVLDQGRLVQFDSPYELIKQKSGIFSELFDNHTQEVKNELLKAAEKVYNSKK